MPEKLRWLECTGQSTWELLGCKESHRIESLLCAFEAGIQAQLGFPAWPPDYWCICIGELDARVERRFGVGIGPAQARTSAWPSAIR